MTQKSKLKILNNCIIPSLTYGAQTWALTKDLRSKIQSTQNRMVRSIMGVKWSDRISNIDLYKKAKIEKVGKRIMGLKFGYAGHLLRKNEFNWTRQILDWTPYGSVRKKRASGG